MRKYGQLFKSIAATVSLVGSGVLLKTVYDREELKASWTTDYEPSVKWDHNWDKREPSSLVKPKHKRHSSENLAQNLNNPNQQNNPNKTTDDLDLGKYSSKASRHLYLIRHGQYEYEAKDAKDMVLTKLGREQAQMTGKRLKELTSHFENVKLHHSTMVRAIETADLIKEELNPNLVAHVDPMLCEGAPIPPEPPVGHWRPLMHFYQDGGRIEAAFRKYFYRAAPEQLEDSCDIIVCHANVIRYLFCRGLQFPPEGWLRLSLAHGSITHIVIRPDGRVSCRVLGEAGFQPAQKVTHG